MDRPLALLLDAFGDVFTATQASSAGVDRRQLRLLVDSGTVQRASRGGYVVRKTSEADSIARIRLALLQHPSCLASHQSALALLNLPTWSLPMDPVHLCFVQGRTRTRERDLVMHSPAPAMRMALVDGWRSVDAATAAAQVAASGALDAAVCAADGALHRELTNVERFAEVVASWGSNRGARIVRAMLELTDGRSESPGETRLRLIVRRLGLAVTPQVWVTANGRRYRVDLLADEYPLILEFDGMVKYEGAGGANALIAEKQREDDLRREHAVIRFAWHDLKPEIVKHHLEQGLRQCRARFLDGRR